MSTVTQQVRQIFAEDGALSQLTGFEYRPQQCAMAEAVAAALERREHLVVEAPTGVGKTLAYLVPSLQYALREHRKAIVSTHTKTLQEQLRRKDIPLVRSILKQDFSAVVLKGRRNYLCTTRLKHALASAAGLFGKEEKEQLQRIHAWSRKTFDGDLENLDFTPHAGTWDMVCSEKGVCSSSTCNRTCFFQQAKERVRHAHLVILNHALFFNLMALQGTEDRFIFDNDFVIFDEAHTLESVAGSGIGKRISRYQVLAAIHRLYNPKTKKGLLGRKELDARALCTETAQTAHDFFESVLRAGKGLASGDARGSNTREIRIRIPCFVANTLSATLATLQTQVGKIAAKSENEAERQELTAAQGYLREAQVLTEEFLEQPESEFTYWIELGGPRRENVTLCTSPSSVADAIAPRLFREETSVIMTSATLSVGGSMEYFKRRLGALGVESLLLDSPFDFRRQTKLRIARDVPEPENESYVLELPRWIMQSIKHSQGKALVLFTSVAMMRSAADALTSELEQCGFTLLVQRSEQQRHSLLEEFRRDIHSVLFGLDSFWMGVDVPGEALEHVIITRLPFAVPNHPLIEARLEEIARRGGNAFLEYTLPEAVLKFRQGFGRLIRSREDKGVVTILDSRILRKRYGKIFLSSIPPSPIELFTVEGETECISLDEA